MRSCLALKFTLLVLTVFAASSPTLAASDTNQQNPARILEPEQVSTGERITVYEKSGRVLDLIVEDVNTTDQANLDTGLTGTYISEITSSDSWYFRHKKHRELVITLEQKGNSITGTDSLTNSEITGTLEGDTIKFEFWSRQLNNNYPVNGKWKVNADGTRLEGSWNHGKWNLTRLDPVVATQHADPPMIKGRLVKDQSAVEVLLADIEKIEAQQDASDNEVSTATDKSTAPLPEARPSKSSHSEFGRHYTECLGKISFVYGGAAIIAGAADLAIFTTASAAVICVPAAGTVVTIEPTMKGSFEASSRKNQTAYRKTEQYRFVALTRENLARDIAHGGGEYLTTMAYLEGCPVEVHDSFAKMAQRNFRQIIPQAEMDTAAILDNLEAQIAKDPLLAFSCVRVS